MEKKGEGADSYSRKGKVEPMVHEREKGLAFGWAEEELEEAILAKRRLLAKFGVKVFDDDKLMPLDGGKAQTKKLMAAYKDKEIKLSVLDKMEAGYPQEERAKQLICEGKIREEGIEDQWC